MQIHTKNELGSIVHPLISTLYLKNDFGSPHPDSSKGVLVIETNFSSDKKDPKTFGAYLNDLLTDLPDIQNQVIARVGPFDRVHIKYS